MMRSAWLPISLALLAAMISPLAAIGEEKPAAPREKKLLGLGIELQAQNSALLVMKVQSGGPAARAGIRRGDRITAIGEKPIKEISVLQLVHFLRGPEGSDVHLTVKTGDQPDRKVKLRRESLDAPPDDEAVVKAAAEAHRRLFEERLKQRRAELEKRLQAQQMQANQELEAGLVNLNGPLPEGLHDALDGEVRLMAKVAQLNPEQSESLKTQGERALLRRGVRDRVVQQRVRVVNGRPVANGVLQVHAEPTEPPHTIVRRELEGVLKTLSPAGWWRFDEERRLLARRARVAEVLVQVAALDEALLLSGEQREKLGTLLTARWSEVWRGPINQPAGGDPARFCLRAASAMGLFSFSGAAGTADADLALILRPSQVAAFKLVQLPTRLETVLSRQPPPRAPAALGNAAPAARPKAAAANVGLFAGMLAPPQEVAWEVVRRGLPADEQRRRLDVSLQCLLDDINAHTRLDTQQKQKLLLAGKIDLGRYCQDHAPPPNGAPPDRVQSVTYQQIAGANVRLPAIFSGPKSLFAKTLRSRLSPDGREKLAAAALARSQFHRQAVLAAVAAELTRFAALTDEQAQQIEQRLADRVAGAANADDPIAARRTMLRELAALDADQFKPLLDDWQWPAARDYIVDLSVTARGLESEPDGDELNPPPEAIQNLFPRP